MSRPMLAGVGCIVLALALTSAPASAATRPPATYLVLQPLPLAQGFELRVTALNLVLFGGKSLQLSVRRRSVRAIESYDNTVKLTARRLSVDRRYRRARIDAGSSLGALGRITLRTVRLGRLRPVRRCGARAWARSVVLAGTLRVDAGRALGSVTRRRVRGEIASASCPPGSRRASCRARYRSFSAFESPLSVEAERWPDGKGVVRYRWLPVPSQPGPLTSASFVVVDPPAAAFAVSEDLGRARLDFGALGAPQLSGALDFVATGPAGLDNVSCNGEGRPSRHGSVTGSLSAAFSQLGVQTMTSPIGQATQHGVGG